MATPTTSNALTGVYYYATTAFKNPYSITLSILFGFAIAFAFTTNAPIGFKFVARRIKEDLGKADSIRNSIIAIHGKSNKGNANDAALVNQYNYIQALKTQYLYVATEFEVFYYSFITLLVFATVATTIVIAVIARKGWDNQSPNLQAAFFGFFFVASLCGIFINVFDYSQNSNNNINKYFYLTNLQTNIYDVLIVVPYNDPKKPTINRDETLINVFAENNKNLKDNTNLFLNIKAGSIPATDITKVLGAQKSTTVEQNGK